MGMEEEVEMTKKMAEIKVKIKRRRKEGKEGMTKRIQKKRSQAVIVMVTVEISLMDWKKD